MSVSAPLQASPAKPERSSLSIGGGLLQRKLTIGASNDPLEQEADRVAEQVMTMPKHSAIGSTPLRIQGLSGQPAGNSDVAPASVEQALACPGTPLKTGLRQGMEQRFGHDFSQVRVHSGAVSEQSARDVNAIAYTVGHNIVFGTGNYVPGTKEGRRLIAHELAHVVQQGGAHRIYTDQRTAKGPLPDSSTDSVSVYQRKSSIQRNVDQRVELSERPEPEVCLVHLHADERKAFETAKIMHAYYPSNFLYVSGTHRYVTVSTSGRSCLVDPNRIFSTKKTTSQCALSNCTLGGKIRERMVADVHNWDLRPKVERCHKNKTLPVIAFHNTESFSTRNYEQGGSDRWAVATSEEEINHDVPNPAGQKLLNVPRNDKSYYKNFIVTTDPAVFYDAEEEGYNVVLQARNPMMINGRQCTGDDGSLSVALRHFHYTNIEAAGKSNAQIGKKTLNEEMAEHVLYMMGIQPRLLDKKSSSSGHIVVSRHSSKGGRNSIQRQEESAEDSIGIESEMPVPRAAISETSTMTLQRQPENRSRQGGSTAAIRAANYMVNHLHDHILIDWWACDCRDNDMNGKSDADDPNERGLKSVGSAPQKKRGGFQVIDGKKCPQDTRVCGTEGRQFEVKGSPPGAPELTTAVEYLTCAKLVSRAYLSAGFQGLPDTGHNAVWALKAYFERHSRSKNKGNRHTDYWEIGDFPGDYREGDLVFSYNRQDADGHAGIVVMDEVGYGNPWVVHLPGTTQRIWSGDTGNAIPYDPRALSDITMERWPQGVRSKFGVGRYYD